MTSSQISSHEQVTIDLVIFVLRNSESIEDSDQIFEEVLRIYDTRMKIKFLCEQFNIVTHNSYGTYIKESKLQKIYHSMLISISERMR